MLVCICFHFKIFHTYLCGTFAERLIPFRKITKPTVASCRGLLSLHKAVSFLDKTGDADLEAIYKAMSNSTQSAPTFVEFPLTVFDPNEISESNGNISAVLSKMQRQMNTWGVERVCFPVCPPLGSFDA